MEDWAPSERRNYLEHMISEYPMDHCFIPTSEVIQKLIFRAGQIKSSKDIVFQINPKEKKRLKNETDIFEDIFEPLAQVKVHQKALNYPDLRKPWEFYEKTSL